MLKFSYLNNILFSKVRDYLFFERIESNLYQNGCDVHEQCY